jgi:hypothetical protein
VILILFILIIVLRIVLFVLGAWIVLNACISALRTFVLPRRAPDIINRAVFIAVRKIFYLRINNASPYEKKDRIMELYAPMTLIGLLLAWLVCVQFGYICMLWAVNEPGVPNGVHSGVYDAFVTSGSSLFTLGFHILNTVNVASTILIFSEATIGLILIAMLIAYLPTIYGAFSRREAAVTMLETRAGSPPSPVNMIKRYSTLKRLDALGELWAQWEVWFVDIEESHTSLTALIFFRSPQPHRSWVGASGTVLDGASLTLACVDIPHDTQADLCIRAGYLALRYIASVFNVDYNSDPSPDDPISITRAEFNVAWDELAEAGVPLKADQDQAWRDFAGWRVNYDRVLLALAELAIIPYTPWVSDRYIDNAPKLVLNWRKKQKRLQRHEWISPSNI